MTSIEIADSFDELEELLRRPVAPAAPVVLTKAGIAYAALIPLDEGPDAETRATWKSRRFQEILTRSRADTTGGREQDFETVVRELGLRKSPS